MSEASASGEFRRPFGETKISESEAALAGTAFRKMTTDSYNSAPETRDDIEGNLMVRGLDLKVEDGGMKIRLHQQIDMKTGKVTIERVSFHEPGEADKDWGPKICDYVAGDGGPEVFRYDAPNAEQRKC